MENLYQGSIFSFLTVPELPKVPVTMAELLPSQLPMLPVSHFASYNISLTSRYDSVLKDAIIPELKVAMVGNLGYQKSLDAFDKRPTFVNLFETESPIVVQNISILSRSTSSKQKVLLQLLIPRII